MSQPLPPDKPVKHPANVALVEELELRGQQAQNKWNKRKHRPEEKRCVKAILYYQVSSVLVSVADVLFYSLRKG